MTCYIKKFTFNFLNITIYVIIILFLSCYAPNIECKSVRVHGRHRNVNPAINQMAIQRKRLKLAKPTVPTVRDAPAKSMSENNRRQEEVKDSAPETNNIAPVGNNPIESTFSSGFKRLFGTLQGLLNGDNPGSETATIKPPAFFPSTIPFFQYDLNSLIKLIENSDDSQIEQLAESALVDTISQLIGIVGIKDLKEWLGLIIMYFVLGPVIIPLFWLPISTFIMIALLGPLFYFNPPSKLNDNVMGHDPIEPEAVEPRGFLNIELNSMRHFNQNRTKIMDSPASIVESCVERLSCQVTRFYRSHPVSQWLSNRLNTTKVEWARRFHNHFTSLREDCSKYRCFTLPPTMRQLLSFWNS